ncbi:hypothetical protein D3C73_1044190 [compost metagenome]
MVHELVSADHISLLNLSEGLAGITVRCNHRPGILIHEHLVHPYLMCFAAEREAGMEEVEDFA